jgi:hypothetical protein
VSVSVSVSAIYTRESRVCVRACVLCVCAWIVTIRTGGDALYVGEKGGLIGEENRFRLRLYV